MARPKFFRSPEYCEYFRLLARLHGLIAAANDESPEGDRLRDQLDVCSEHFTDDEIASLSGLSGDLYSLTELPVALQPRNASVSEQLVEAMHAQHAGDSVRALALLRANRRSIPAAQLAYMRGRIISEAGLYDIAWRFFQVAAKWDPTNANFQFIALDALNRFDVTRARALADAILAAPNEQPPKLLLKAAEIRLNSSSGLDGAAGGLIRTELIPLFEHIILDFEAGCDGGDSSHLLPLAYALCGFCFQDLGEMPKARRCLDQALHLDRNNDALLTARGILLYGHDSAAARSDFQAAVALESPHSPHALPYLFLAHHFLLQNRHDACVAMCEQALQRPLADKVRANCFEWIAICQTMLGSAPQNVRASFDRAVQLAPQNERIQRNRRAFEDCLAAASMESIQWETDAESELRELGRSEFHLAA